MTILLECAGIQKRFGQVVVTEGIDLTVSSGEAVGIIGSNGAGKTTLLNMVSGYLKPSAGTIRFRGQDITGLPPRSIAYLGIARSFQIPQLFNQATVIENMMLSTALLAERASGPWRPFASARLQARARAALASFGLEREAERQVSELPQGVRKLLDIAMATCAQPELILLDEPTSGVGSEEKHALMETLDVHFAKADATVVFIEHDMEIVRRHATRVVALYDGRVIANGSVDEVFGNAEVSRFISGTKNEQEAAHVAHA